LRCSEAISKQIEELIKKVQKGQVEENTCAINPQAKRMRIGVSERVIAQQQQNQIISEDITKWQENTTHILELMSDCYSLPLSDLLSSLHDLRK